MRLLLRGAQASQWGEAIVKRLDEQYRGLGKMASYKTAVMDLLIELALSGRYSHILEEWIETLVTDLVKDEVGHEGINNVLETCLKLAKRGNEIVLRSFLENYEKILGQFIFGTMGPLGNNSYLNFTVFNIHNIPQVWLTRAKNQN